MSSEEEEQDSSDGIIEIDEEFAPSTLQRYVSFYTLQLTCLMIIGGNTLFV